MSSGDFEKLFKQFSAVSKLVVDGKREASIVSEALQSIIDSPSCGVKAQPLPVARQVLPWTEGANEPLRIWFSRLLLPIEVLGFGDDAMILLRANNALFLGSLLFFNDLKVEEMRVRDPLKLANNFIAKDTQKSVNEFRVILKRVDVQIADDLDFVLIGTTPEFCGVLLLLFKVFWCMQTPGGVHGLKCDNTFHRGKGLAIDVKRSDYQYHGFISGER